MNYFLRNNAKYFLVLCLSFTFLYSNDSNTTSPYSQNYIFPIGYSTNDPVAALIGATLIGVIHNDRILKDMKKSYEKPLNKDFKYLEELEKNIIKVKNK
ncbi:MAG: hypothetical protein U9Q20_07670 [Campylobacterota bacterium]|nr:hypothetical protein [Campylobacterota bacterium]